MVLTARHTEKRFFDLNKILADAIAKISAKTVRKPIAGLRRDVAALKREVAELKRHAKYLQKQAPVAAPAETEEQGAPKIRSTSKTVFALRKKLGLSQAEFGKLAGVSPLTVHNWEKAGGRIRMRGPALQGFARVRAMGKRQAKKELAITLSRSSI